MPSFALGLDFGTESVRAALVDVATGDVRATAVHRYADGVIDHALPGGSVTLPADWALQNPADWLSGLEAAVRAALRHSGIAGETVIGLGIDFTSCTVLPTRADGTPLAARPDLRTNPHAWPKLWKHHAAQAQADRVTEMAADRREPWLKRYGGRISSEWLLPKALQIAEEAPHVYAAADRILEGADWIVWQLTGQLVRNACAAGYKALWHKQEGYPSERFLAALHPALADLYRDKVAGPVVAPGAMVGGLTAAWASRLGLCEGCPVAAPIIDAHAAVIGGAIGGPDTLFMMMGTSTCHLLMAEREEPVEGIAGVVEDGIVPGYFAYESGQAGVGDAFGWFVQQAVPPAYHEEASRRKVGLHQVLTDKAAALAPGQSGLLALDWWNGNRSTLVDASLSGLLVGATLSTRAEHIYRALIEATAFGTRVIIDAFTGQGLPVAAVVAGGGLTRNPLLMQIYADVTGRAIAVTGAPEASALGAAMLGAVAAGEAAGGYDSLSAAVVTMAPPPSRVYQPIPRHQAIYDQLFREYCLLYDHFGRGASHVMKVLRRFRDDTTARGNDDDT